MWLVMAILGVLISPSFYRVVAGSVRAVREELYIDAAKVAGLSDARVIGRHVLTAVRAPAVLLVAGIFAVGVGIQAILDFLGLGDTSLPTWGGMLSEGFYNIFRDAGAHAVAKPRDRADLHRVDSARHGTARRARVHGRPGHASALTPGAPPEPRPTPAVVHTACGGGRLPLLRDHRPRRRLPQRARAGRPSSTA